MSHEKEAEAQAMVDRLHQLREEQAAIQADGTDVKLLADAISRLGDRRVSLSIQAAVHVRPEGPRLPISECQDQEAMTQIMDHTFKTTVAALRQSQLQVSNLGVYDKQWGGFVTMKGLYDAIAVESRPLKTLRAFEVPRPLHNIQSLTLNLHEPPVVKIGEEQPDPYFDLDPPFPIYGPKCPVDLHEAYLASLAGFLHPIAHGMQDLNIRFRGWHAISLDCVNVFGQIASSNIPFPSLTKLHLHNVIIQNTDLLALLCSMPVLTQLGLHRVSLPHDPSHPKKLVDYPDARPAWTQMEPDIEGWKDAWKSVFDAFLMQQNNGVGGKASLTHDVEDNVLLSPCPRLEILEIDSLYLTSFEQIIFFTAPHSAISAYVHTIMDNEALRDQYRFKVRAFQEGLACCVFTGHELRGEVTTANNDAPDGANEEAKKHLVREHSFYDPLPPPLSEEPQGIQYIVSTTRPFGSPDYYRWRHFWEATEFREMGCALQATTTTNQPTTVAPRVTTSGEEYFLAAMLART